MSSLVLLLAAAVAIAAASRQTVKVKGSVFCPPDGGKANGITVNVYNKNFGTFCFRYFGFHVFCERRRPDFDCRELGPSEIETSMLDKGIIMTYDRDSLRFFLKDLRRLEHPFRRGFHQEHNPSSIFRKGQQNGRRNNRRELQLRFQCYGQRNLECRSRAEDLPQVRIQQLCRPLQGVAVQNPRQVAYKILPEILEGM